MKAINVHQTLKSSESAANEKSAFKIRGQCSKHGDAGCRSISIDLTEVCFGAISWALRRLFASRVGERHWHIWACHSVCSESGWAHHTAWHALVTCCPETPLAMQSPQELPSQTPMVLLRRQPQITCCPQAPHFLKAAFGKRWTPFLDLTKSSVSPGNSLKPRTC